MKEERLIRVSVLIVLILAGYQWLMAAYLTDIPVQVNQPNGTAINCFASGDEYYNWLHDAAGYTIIQSPDTGYYTYAIQSGNTVAASGLIVGKTDPSVSGLTPGVNISQESYQQRRASAFPEQVTRNAPTTGTINSVVIFIRFSDQSEFGEAISHYNGLFNTDAVSQKNYFLEASYNQLTVNTTFYPTPTTMVVSWQDIAHPRGYYCPYNATTNPLGYSSADPYDNRHTREQTLLANAVNGVSSQIPSGLNLDGDNDNFVDNVCFVIRGNIFSITDWNGLLWPHKWTLIAQNVNISGMRVANYDFQLQDVVNNSQNGGVGTLCHEFFHTLGAPDLYMQGYAQNDPVGGWDLMGITANPPQQMSVYMKYKYGHWLSSIPEISANQTYTLNPVTSSTNNVYRINSPYVTNEYFIVEYRKNGAPEGLLPGASGMLIYRINSEYLGNTLGYYEVYIYRPSGNNGYYNAPYGSETGQTMINATTDPSPLLTNGNDGGLYIDQIGSADNTISFRLRMNQIHGTVALSPANQSDLVLTTIKLRRTGTNELIAQTNPNSDGNYFFNTDPGTYFIEYGLFQPSLNKYCYPVISGPIQVAQVTNSITVPPVTLYTMLPGNLMVKSTGTGGWFNNLNDAAVYAQAIINSTFFANTTLFINVVEGNYTWPSSATYLGTGGMSFSYSNPSITNKGITIRKVGSGTVTITPTDISQVNVNLTNIKLSFERINFTQGNSIETRCLYKMQGNIRSSFMFYNCTFGNTNDTQYSFMQFANSSDITISTCQFYGWKGVYYEPIPGYYWMNFGVLSFNSCTNVNVDASTFNNNSAMRGGAIHCDASSHVVITNSTFNNNRSDALGIDCDDGTPGGAICIENSNDVQIRGNYFNTNTSTAGGVLHIDNSLFKIQQNIFSNNITQHIGLSRPCIGISWQNCAFSATDIMSNNVITSTGSPSDFLLISYGCTGHFTINKCDFIKSSSGGDEAIIRLESSGTVNTTFNNSIFQTGNIDAAFISYGPSSTFTVKNSLFNQGYTGASGDPTALTDISNMYLDSNYVPIWNAASMSPCIDTGTGVNDPDGTPADIGAKTASTHAYWKYIFRNGCNADVPSQRNEVWHWVSYPVINTITNGARGADVFFNELLGKHQDSYQNWHPNILQDIRWREENVQHDILWHVDDMNPELTNWAISFNNNIDTDLSHHSVTSQQGYKVQLIPFGDAYPTNPESVVLHESGQAILPTSYVNLHGSANLSPDQPYENWVGYFSPYCSWPQDAFSSIWDDIIMIKAKDWCLYRSRSNGNFSALSGTMYPLQCGDMVIVVTRNDHPHFQWNYQTPVDPRTKPRSEYFTYDEKPDYVPVTIDLMGIEKADLKEIALKINGICKGAVVVESDVEQLCAYLNTDEKLTDGNVELIYYYDHGKNQPQCVQSIPLTKNSINCEYINGGIAYPVYTIKAGSSDQNSNIASVTVLEQNSPNPFNSITKINYSLKSAGEMSLDIFNVKGQLVRTIYCGKSDKGHFSTVWNGKDNRGNTCSSGIYFCKLRTGDSTHVRKMMLMR